MLQVACWNLQVICSRLLWICSWGHATVHKPLRVGHHLFGISASTQRMPRKACLFVYGATCQAHVHRLCCSQGPGMPQQAGAADTAAPH
jgi:hypothetical protein